MTHYSPVRAAPRGPHRAIPAFHAVPVRGRVDGWTPLKQAEFIGHLAETRSVTRAARLVSMARETAYRLRAKQGAEGFNAAWDAAMARLGSERGRAQYLATLNVAREALKPSRKVTIRELEWRIETGYWKVILHRGRYVGVRQKPDNSALLTLVARMDCSRKGRW